MFKKLLVGVILGMSVSSYAFAERDTMGVYASGIPCSKLLYGSFEQTYPYKLFVLGIASGMTLKRGYVRGEETAKVMPAMVFIAYVEEYCRKNKDSLLWLATAKTYNDLMNSRGK